MAETAQSTDLALERLFDAPRELVWRAWTDPEHVKKWWAPRPYQTPEVEIDLRPGGRFFTHMTGPDGHDFSGTGCFLEVVDGEKLVWTSALGEGWRPNDLGPADCGGFPFTAIVSFEDAGDGRTRYRVVAMHSNVADSEKHAEMGFHAGWGTCADQLGEVAASLEPSA